MSLADETTEKAYVTRKERKRDKKIRKEGDDREKKCH